MNDERGTRDQGLAGADGLDSQGQNEGLRSGPAPGPGAGHGPDGPSGSDAPAPSGLGLSAPGLSADQGRAGDPALGPPGRARVGDGPRPGPPGQDGLDGRRNSRRSKSKARSWWVELPVLLAFALLLALLIKTFMMQAFFIPSASMENTLEIGDKVLVNKMVYDFRPIHRGDIVVFNGEGSWNAQPASSPGPMARLWNAITSLFGTAPGAHDYIKRVVGLPGDQVACCDAHQRVTVNGVPLNERSYLYPGDLPSTTRFDFTVPAGRLWVMGDHRRVSYDSRGHSADPGDGTIPENKVVGRAFVIVAPISRWRVLSIPATFEQPKLGALPAWSSAPAEGAPALLGLVGAVPLTALERRMRRRLARSLRRRRSRPPGTRRRWRRDRHG